MIYNLKQLGHDVSLERKQNIAVDVTTGPFGCCCQVSVGLLAGTGRRQENSRQKKKKKALQVMDKAGTHKKSKAFV